MDQTAPYYVLVVDDDPADAALVSKAIGVGRFNCVVERAIDGVEAMERLRMQPPPSTDRHPPPHLVLLDINMPRKNGFQVLSEIRADPHLRHLPVVMLSTSTAERDVTSAYQSGAHGYVTKPMDVDDLFQAIHGIQEYWFNTVRRPKA
ncbi:MAG: response regulator [Phaeospirillum sp.]|nr:response regulator [Phaeospirillum sp.]